MAWHACMLAGQKKSTSAARDWMRWEGKEYSHLLEADTVRKKVNLLRSEWKFVYQPWGRRVLSPTEGARFEGNIEMRGRRVSKWLLLTGGGHSQQASWMQHVLPLNKANFLRERIWRHHADEEVLTGGGFIQCFDRTTKLKAERDVHMLSDLTD